MSDVPESKSALKRMARRYQNSIARRRREGREKSERMYEVAGAMFGLPALKQLTKNFNLPLLDQVTVDEKLQTAGIAWGISEFTSGRISDAAWGTCLGAIGASSWEGEGLLAGLFGGDES